MLTSLVLQSVLTMHFSKIYNEMVYKMLSYRVGYKEEATVDTKREVTQPVPEGEVDRDDERPTVVVLREGDVGEEEYHQYLQQQTELVSSDSKNSSPFLSLFWPHKCIF